jgi:hypothetical protein
LNFLDRDYIILYLPTKGLGWQNSFCDISSSWTRWEEGAVPPPRHGLDVNRHIQIKAAMHPGARWIDFQIVRVPASCNVARKFCVKQLGWMADEIEQPMSLEIPCLLYFKVSVTRAGDM